MSDTLNDTLREIKAAEVAKDEGYPIPAKFGAGVYRKDEGVDFCDIIGKVEETDLLHLRDVLAEHVTEQLELERETVQSVIRFLIGGIESEVGARWVSSRSTFGGASRRK